MKDESLIENENDTQNEDDFVLMNEDDAGAGAAQCAGSISSAAPEHVEACVVQGLPVKKQKKTIEERISERKAKNEELKEAIRNDGIRDYLQKNQGPLDYPEKPALKKRPEVERVNYKGSEDYEKQRKGWLKGKNRSKAFEDYYDGNPGRNHTVGDIELDNRFEDGQVDEFLSWYYDTFSKKSK